ncbi:Regulator of nonsense transcripts UPF3 [Euphorbia peplus]|nr:Regulator of nonsense transcripts UPF3 [Euphorbia peplus]
MGSRAKTTADKKNFSTNIRARYGAPFPVYTVVEGSRYKHFSGKKVDAIELLFAALIRASKLGHQHVPHGNFITSLVMGAWGELENFQSEDFSHMPMLDFKVPDRADLVHRMSLFKRYEERTAKLYVMNSFVSNQRSRKNLQRGSSSAGPSEDADVDDDDEEEEEEEDESGLQSIIRAPNPSRSTLFLHEEDVFGDMKGQSEKTKVVVRHLPPTITQVMLMDQIDVVFGGRYNWASFRPGKSSQKHQSFSRAYIDFKKPEDVIEFAEFFNGHLFVNEKGTQFRAVVEYAPSQRVPKQWSKKDGREGTISKDPAYLEFLESISKPVENLPSAEIQLERREAERVGAPKDAPIVTPLMDFVRQKRASKSGSRRILSNGKVSRRTGASGSASSSKRSSEKKRVSTTMYVLRDTAKNTSGKDKSTYLLVPKRDDQQLSDKAVTFASQSGAEVLEDESGVPGIADAGKKKILLLKGKEKEISPNAASFDKNVIGPAMKQNQRASGRIIRSILLNKDSRQNQSSGNQFEQQAQTINLEKEKRPPRSPHVHVVAKDSNGASDDKIADGSYVSDESLPSASQSSQSVGDSYQGSHKHFGRRGPSHSVRDADVSSVEGKPSKRGGVPNYGSHEFLTEAGLGSKVKFWFIVFLNSGRLRVL